MRRLVSFLVLAFLAGVDVAVAVQGATLRSLPAGRHSSGARVDRANLAAIARPVRMAVDSAACAVEYTDFGDAPEGVTAYPSTSQIGTVGRFPTCLAPTAAGTASGSLACPLPFTGGAVGFVKHVSEAGRHPFWIGCTSLPGVDSEINGKTSRVHGDFGACDPSVGFDCLDFLVNYPVTMGFNIMADECPGDGEDAGVLAVLPNLGSLDAPFTFYPCRESRIQLEAYSCGPPRSVYLNVLVDWNEDGDWLDKLTCVSTADCADEWPVRNLEIVLSPGCNALESPAFRAGPRAGVGWMRVSISEDPAPADFAWNGTVSLANSAFQLGETEDYPVLIDGSEQVCRASYHDSGDAPEGFAAYPSGIVGRFPTCHAPSSPPGDQETFTCAPHSTPPGSTGRVIHVSNETDPFHFWFGCGRAGWADYDIEGKVSPGGALSSCDGEEPIDCYESAFGGAMTFGQDECYGSADAGIASPVSLVACELGEFQERLNNCSLEELTVYLNVLVDWNQDGDWNDVLQCPGLECTPEWAVKNAPVTLVPGCNPITIPSFRVGYRPGTAWMRVTATVVSVRDDFPWNGSVGMPAGIFNGGETEDHLVDILPGNTGVEPAPREPMAWLAAPEPNPSSAGVTLRFGLVRPGPAMLAVYDLAGRRIVELARGQRTAGTHALRWDHRDAGGRALPAGIYLLKLEVEGRSFTRRLMLLH